MQEACGECRRRVASAGGAWRVQEAGGECRRRVASAGGVRRVQEACGECWRRVASAGGVWRVQEARGECRRCRAPPRGRRPAGATPLHQRRPPPQNPAPLLSGLAALRCAATTRRSRSAPSRDATVPRQLPLSPLPLWPSPPPPHSAFRHMRPHPCIWRGEGGGGACCCTMSAADGASRARKGGQVACRSRPALIDAMASESPRGGRSR